MTNKSKSIFWILFSTLCFGSHGIWARMIGDGLGEAYQAMTRALIILLVLAPLTFFKKKWQPVEKDSIKWFALVSLSGAFTFIPFFIAFNHLTIGTVTLLFYASLTITTFILGKFFFAELLSKQKLLSLLLAVIGLLAIYQLEVKANTIFPAIAAIAAGMFGGIEVVFTKKISGKYSAEQISTILFLVTSVVHIPLLFVLQEPIVVPELSTVWVGQLGYAVAMLLAFYAVVKGYKHIEPSLGGILGLSEIIIAIFLGIVLFGEKLTVGIVIGSIAILASSLISLKQEPDSA